MNHDLVQLLLCMNDQFDLDEEEWGWVQNYNEPRITDFNAAQDSTETLRCECNIICSSKKCHLESLTRMLDHIVMSAQLLYECHTPY